VLGPEVTPQGMPTLPTSWLEVRHVMHWLEKGTLCRCLVCFVRKKQSRTIYVCPKCKVALCVVLCFKIYHIHSKFRHQPTMGKADHAVDKYHYAMILFDTKMLHISGLKGCGF